MCTTHFGVEKAESVSFIFNASAYDFFVQATFCAEMVSPSSLPFVVLLFAANQPQTGSWLVGVGGGWRQFARKQPFPAKHHREESQSLMGWLCCAQISSPSPLINNQREGRGRLRRERMGLRRTAFSSFSSLSFLPTQ